MKINLKGPARIFWIVPLVSFILFSVLNYRTGEIAPNFQIWKGYYTLLIRTDATFDAENILKQEGFEVVSLSNQMVDFFDYCGMRSIPLMDIEEHLDKLDPRIDPFMKKLPGFFSTRYMDADWDIIYLSSDQSVNQITGDLESIFPVNTSSEWILADEKTKSNPWIPILFGLFFLVMAVFMGKSVWRILFFALPWIGIFQGGNLALFIAGGFLAVSLFFIRNRGLKIWKEHLEYPITRYLIKEKLRFPLILFLGTLIITLIWIGRMGLGNRAFLYLISGALGQISAELMELFYEYLKVKRRDHKLFVPIFILKKPGRKVSGGELLAPILPAMVLAAALILPLDVEEITAPVPAPVFLSNGEEFVGYDADGLKRLENSREESQYPDLADYIAHEAFQEVFFFGGSYGFPNTGDRIEQEVILVEKGEVQKDLVVIKEFTDQWYIDILSLEKKEGVVAILLNQEAPCRIETAGMGTVGELTSWKRGASAVFSLYFFAFLLFLIIKNKRKFRFGKAKAETLTYIRELEKENIA
ncbi:MAG: hypothetical protein JEY99_13650 [Spirochaetales bacterium]|nr:hypothetical protein [Spirochaetales bacterium]